MKQVTRYKCDYCKRAYASKYKALDHERKCFFNPANKSCITCRHNDIKEILDNEGYPRDAVGWCFKMNREIFRKGCVVKDCPKWESEVEEG